MKKEELTLIEKCCISIWERDFELPINYNCYEGEIVTDEQLLLLKEFFSHPEWINKSKNIVVKYCEQQVLDDDENQKKDNIFSYIKPMSVFVKNVKRPRVALICKYRYDEEHGLAIVFDKMGNINVGPEDIIL